MVFTSKNVDWWCERGILLLVLSMLVFAPLAFGAVYVWSFLVVQALMIGIGLLWIIRLWAGHKPKLLWPPLGWVVAAFVLYAVGRYFTADIEYVARQELIRILMYSFLFLAVVNNLYGQEEAETITYTLTIVAALTASYALTQFAHHSLHVWNLTTPYAGRASGTYINPDHFAGFLELVLPLPLAFLMAGRVGVITRVLLAYAILTILGGLAVTFSRGGWIAAAAGVAMVLGFLLCHRNHRLRALVVVVLLVAFGGYFTANVLSNSVGFMRRVVKTEEGGPTVLDTSSRLQIWSGAVQMWRDHPLWGVGPGHFDYRFREYRPQGLQSRPEHAHDDYLELLTDWGLVGGVIIFGGIGIFIFGLVKTWPHVRREESDFGTGMSSRYAFFIGAVSGLFALAVHSLMDFNLHVPANALVGVTILGLVASNLRFSTQQYWMRARQPLQWGFTAVLVGLMSFWALQGWRRGGEELWTLRAEKVKMGPDYSTEQAAMLQKAMAYEPKNYLTWYNIGECYRLQSLDGGDNYADLAQKALSFYAQGMRLNPYDELCQLRTGMCLDWLNRHADAEKYYTAAETLDPNGSFVVANIGWHYVQIGDFAAARQWFIRANKLSFGQDEISKSYISEICQPKLIQKASGQLPMSMFYNGKDN